MPSGNEVSCYRAKRFLKNLIPQIDLETFVFKVYFFYSIADKPHRYGIFDNKKIKKMKNRCENRPELWYTIRKRE